MTSSLPVAHEQGAHYWYSISSYPCSLTDATLFAYALHPSCHLVMPNMP
jgi:hypothetical protein